VAGKNFDRKRKPASGRLVAVSAGLVVLMVVPLLALGGDAADSEAGATSGRSKFVTRPGFDAPVLRVTRSEPEASSGRIFVGSKDVGKAIYRSDGELVWFRPGRATDFRSQRFRGRPVLTWFEAPTKGSGLKGNRLLIADRKYRIFRKLKPGRGYVADSHEFRLTPRGTAYSTIYKARPRDLTAFGGTVNDRVSDSIAQEIDIRTGRVVWQWRSLRHVPISDTVVDKRKKPGNPFDYFHINSIADTPDGNILISGRGTNAIYKVSRKTGRILWTLGGKRSDFRMADGATFFQQHDAQVVRGGRISLFDNTASPTVTARPREQSRGLVLALDHKEKVARVARQFFHPSRPLSEHQANTQPLGNGNYLVGWWAVPLISEHLPSGRVVFDARVLGISSFYRAYRMPWDGLAPGRPLVVARQGEAGSSIYVSWNGDTRVKKWRVRGGNSSGDLRVLKTVPREGFETRIGIGPASRWVRVEGLDAKGKRIGTSKPVRVD
jgi:hypothetical protein